MVHINALPSHIRSSRGRRANMNIMCRAGWCGRPETPTHCIQVCHRTHGARLLRQDALTRALTEDLQAVGWTVKRELRVPTGVGIRQPDFVVVRRGRRYTPVFDRAWGPVSGRYTKFCLMGSWMNWCRFNASTASRMGRRGRLNRQLVQLVYPV